MNSKPGAESALVTRVLRALAVNRKAKISFPGIFMELRGTRHADESLTLEFDDGAWCRNSGGVNMTALSVLVDTALGAVTRFRLGPTVRPATVQLAIQFTGAPMPDHLALHAQFLDHAVNVKARQTFSRGTIVSGDVPVAHASGAFVMLDLPDGATQAAMPWPTGGLAIETPLDPAALEEHERTVVAAARQSEAAATDAAPFIDQFWCGVARPVDGGAALKVEVSPHLGNRVGQVHGGVLLGLASSVAAAAVPDTMRLSNISSWFISPGQGPALDVQASVLHRGRNLAVVRTEVRGANGALVLDATSQHVRVNTPGDGVTE
jgi:acyl-coenzyme A thioesterase PaaI-like protein